VASYTPAVVDGVKKSVAAKIDGVDASSVTVEVSAASVKLTITINVKDETAKAAVTSTVSTELSTTTSATSFLTANLPQGTTLTVSEVRTVPTVASSSNIGGIVGGVVGGVVAILIVILIVAMMMMKKGCFATTADKKVAPA